MKPSFAQKFTLVFFGVAALLSFIFGSYQYGIPVGMLTSLWCVLIVFILAVCIRYVNDGHWDGRFVTMGVSLIVFFICVSLSLVLWFTPQFFIQLNFK